MPVLFSHISLFRKLYQYTKPGMVSSQSYLLVFSSVTRSCKEQRYEENTKVDTRSFSRAKGDPPGCLKKSAGGSWSGSSAGRANYTSNHTVKRPCRRSYS